MTAPAPACRFLRCMLTALLLLAGIWVAGPAAAQASDAPDRRVAPVAGCSILEEEPTEAFVPKVRPEVYATRVTESITVDGRIDEPAWADATRLGGFTEIQPGDQEPPPVCTEVLVAYDAAHLYLAFRAYDPDPSAIRASLRNRDEIFQDDWVGIILDPYGDAAQAYELFANPYGIQGDLMMSGSGGEDVGFDVVYQSEGRITDDGYRVEMAIPFASLRFPDRNVQSWRLNVLRTRPRGSREQYAWASVDRDDPCFLCQFGTLSGIQDIKPSTNLSVIPALVGTQSASLTDPDVPRSGLDNGRMRLEPSANLRYNVTPSLSAEATVNPDFSQVESDAARVDVNSTFALFFPERRPFFQEGSELFDTYMDIVYTRSINAPIAAGKVTGRFGRTSVAYLSAVDESTPMLLPFEEESAMVGAGQSASNILRARRTIGENSFVGATLTDRRLLDVAGSGSVVSADGRWQLSDTYRAEAQVALSNTREPVSASLSEDVEVGTFDRGAHTAALDGERFAGSALFLSFDRTARHWNFDIGYTQYSPTFRTPNGFETRNAYRQLRMWQGYQFYFDDAIVERLEPGAFLFTEQNSAGEPTETYGQIQIWSRWKGQTFVFMNLGLGREEFAEVMFERLTNWNVNVNSNFSDIVQGGFNVNGGRSIYRDDAPQLGRSLNASVWLTVQPMDRLTLQPQLSYATLQKQTGDGVFFEGYIARMRTGFQFTRELSARLVTQYNHFDGNVSLEPLVSYQLNPFSVFHFGTTHGYDVLPNTPNALAQTDRQVFFKFQYLFRV